MNITALCEKYREALGRKDLPAVRSLFTPEALIKAPISGTVTVDDFHTYLFAATKKAVARFPNLLGARRRLPSYSMQFSYTLSIANGDVISLDGVIVFEVDESQEKFKGMTVKYDATDLRRFMDEAGISRPDSAN